jgi:acyl-CoA thioester hydrolase
MSAVFSWPVRVYWEDTDAGGIVFYANYLKFFERSRTEWLRERGIHQQAMRETTGGMFVVGEVHVRYLRSARLDDELLVTTQLKKCGRAAMTIHQEAFLKHLTRRCCCVRQLFARAGSMTWANLPESPKLSWTP